VDRHGNPVANARPAEDNHTGPGYASTWTTLEERIAASAPLADANGASAS